MLSPSTVSGIYTLRLFRDNPLIMLVATQSGSPKARFVYTWLAACSASGRQGVPEVSRPLWVTVLGQQVVVEVRGAEGQPLQLSLINLQGQVVSERVVEQAGSMETQSLPVSGVVDTKPPFSPRKGLNSLYNNDLHKILCF